MPIIRKLVEIEERPDDKKLFNVEDLILKINKICAIIFYVAALLDYVNAFLYFTGSNSKMGIVWLCIGSCMLCSGSLYLKKDKNDKVKK